MEVFRDFIQCLEPDMSVKILMCLDDPADLVRVRTVSSLWKEFVIKNALCKHLCIKTFPEISSISDDIEAKNLIEPVESMPEDSIKRDLYRDHRIYAFLARGLSPFITNDCVSKAISASSTDNYPEESIRNTLKYGDSVEGRASYWSSKGTNDPTVTEALIYKLISNLCVITEIHLQPFQAFFQFGFPVYSAKYVRFRMGHQRFPEEVKGKKIDDSTAAFSNDKFEWTYTSPQFPMIQEKRLQKFKLPKPVLCIGGILGIELLGRAQRQAVDDLFYICIAHVDVVGRPLSPAFDVERVDDKKSSAKWALKYSPEKLKNPNNDNNNNNSPFRVRSLTASIRGWLLGGGAFPRARHNHDDHDNNDIIIHQ